MVRRSAILWVAVLAACVLLPGAAWAAEFRAEGDSQEIGGSVDDDVYVAGDQILVSGDVTGDVLAVGRRVRVTGSTGASLFAGAQTVEISGTVGHSARIGAQQIEVSGTIERDLLGGAQSIEIGEQARVGRDVVAGTAELDIAGRVDGNILAGAGTLRISGTVGGDVEVESDNVTLADGARIEGNLIYTSANEADIDPGAEVAGEVERREPRAAQDDPGNPVVDAIVDFLQDVAGAFILGLVVLWLVPGLLPHLAATIRTAPLPSLGVGLAALFLTPIVALIVLIPALILGAGASLVLVALAVWGFLLLLAKAAAGLLLGDLILRRRKGEMPDFKESVLSLLLGVAILSLLSALPFIGGLVDFLVGIVALGAGLVAFTRWRKARTAVPPEPPAVPPAPEVSAA